MEGGPEERVGPAREEVADVDDDGLHPPKGKKEKKTPEKEVRVGLGGSGWEGTHVGDRSRGNELSRARVLDFQPSDIVLEQQRRGAVIRVGPKFCRSLLFVRENKARGRGGGKRSDGPGSVVGGGTLRNGRVTQQAQIMALVVAQPAIHPVSLVRWGGMGGRGRTCQSRIRRC